MSAPRAVKRVSVLIRLEPDDLLLIDLAKGNDETRQDWISRHLRAAASQQTLRQIGGTGR